MDYNEKVEYTAEGMKKAIESLDFLPPELAEQLGALFISLANYF